MPLVSIIVPAYNLSDYIDQCIESIVHQTLGDIEIIIINDGSTDDTAIKCKRLASNYSKIVYAEQENAGPGSARNHGIKRAKADYVMFVDGDDWIDLHMAEKLYDKAMEYDADMVFCSYFNYTDKLTIQESKIKIPTFMSIDDNHELIYALTPSVCDKLIKKELFINNSIFFPEKHRNEDMAVMPLITYFSRRIAQVDEPLYYYRLKRPGNFSTSIAKNNSQNDILIVLQQLISTFKEKKMFDKYFLPLKIFSKIQLTNWVHLCNLNLDSHQANDVIKKYIAFYDVMFHSPDCEQIRIGIHGSYNSRATLQSLYFSRQTIEFYYSNSSIISAVAQPIDINPDDISDNNPFRKKTFLDDCFKKFASDSKQLCQADYILIDFLDERFDICKISGSYLTLSDAFRDCYLSKADHMEIIRDDKTIFDLWKNSCLQFIDMLKQSFKPEQIILNQVYLCECYGNTHDRHLYDNIDCIQTINDRLSSYYAYFKEAMPGIHVIALSDNLYHFTQQAHRYGCYEYHLNEMAYMDLAGQIAIITNKGVIK